VEYWGIGVQVRGVLRVALYCACARGEVAAVWESKDARHHMLNKDLQICSRETHSEMSLHCSPSAALDYVFCAT
jgi:hypothetical protein